MRAKQNKWKRLIQLVVALTLTFSSHVAPKPVDAAVAGCDPSKWSLTGTNLLNQNRYNSPALCNAGVAEDIRERSLNGLAFTDSDCPSGSNPVEIRVARDEYPTLDLTKAQKERTTVMRWLVQLPADVQMRVRRTQSTSTAVGAGVGYETDNFKIELSASYGLTNADTTSLRFDDKRSPGTGGGLEVGSIATTYIVSFEDVRYQRYFQEVCVNWSNNKVTRLMKDSSYCRYGSLTPLWRCGLTDEVREFTAYLTKNPETQIKNAAIPKCADVYSQLPSNRKTILVSNSDTPRVRTASSTTTFGVNATFKQVNMNWQQSGTYGFEIEFINGGSAKSASNTYPNSKFYRYLCSVDMSNEHTKGTFANLRGTGWDSGSGSATVPPFGMVISMSTLATTP